jgi:hypothetical protein
LRESATDGVVTRSSSGENVIDIEADIEREIEEAEYLCGACAWWRHGGRDSSCGDNYARNEDVRECSVEWEEG